MSRREEVRLQPDAAREPLSLIVLAYNEADNVAPVLEELTAWLAAYEHDAELLFVDDGSTDETARIAERALAGKNARVLRHPKNRGIGAGIKTGVRAAHHPWVTFMSADGQIEPGGIATLRDTAARQGCSLVLSVYERRDDGSMRKVLSWGVRALIRAIYGISLRCEGPYLFRREHFDADLLKPESFFLNFEFPIRMLRAGHAVSVAEIRCRPRLGGVSKTANLKTVWKVAVDLLALRVRMMRE